MGGLDKLNVRQSAVVNEGAPTALQTANLGLRTHDADEGEELDTSAGRRHLAPQGRAGARALAVRRPGARHPRHRRRLPGARRLRDRSGPRLHAARHRLGRAGRDPRHGGRVASSSPTATRSGRTLRIGDTPVQVVGRPQGARLPVPRRPAQHLPLAKPHHRACPTTLVARRFEGDQYHRVDRVTFRIRKLDAMAKFSKGLSSHAQGEPPPAGGLPPRRRRARASARSSRQGDVYDIIFLLSGFLSLIGGGIVNVNIQMATLKERIREVGVKMAIGASGPRGLQGVHDGGAAADGRGLDRGTRHRRRLLEDHHGARSASRSTSTRRASSSAYALAAVFGFVFALFPAWKASRLSPMEALRYE